MIDYIESKGGTAEEMQLRGVLHKIRRDADNGFKETFIPLSNLDKVDIKTFRYNVLANDGFSSEVFKTKLDGQKILRIFWNC